MRPLAVALLLCGLAGPGVAWGGVIDIRTFGAVPNDGIDDGAAISGAISAAAAGDTVFIPTGTFDITQPIVVKSNLAIEGAARAQSIVRYTGTASNVLMSMQGVSNVTVGKFTLSGNSNEKVTQGVQAANSSNISINDLAVRDLTIRTGFGPHAVYFANDVTNSSIENSAFSNIGTASTWGAGVRVAWRSTNNRIIGNSIAGTGRGGILVNDLSAGAVIRGNRVTGSGGTGLGIEVWGGSDRAIIEDNRLDHWLSIDASNRVAVRRNVISDKSGIYKYTGLELVDAGDSIFTDNVVDGGQKLGISISGSKPKQRVLWARNSIKGASTWGMQVQGETGGASEQYFYQNTFEQTLRNSPATLFAPQGHGVRFNGNSRNIVLDSNTIQSNGGSGVQITGSNVMNLEFLNNTITGNALKAYEGSTSAAATWFGNSVSGNGDNSQPPGTGANGWDPSSPMINDIDVGDSIRFSFTFPDGAATRVLWDFGEGLPSTDLNPIYAYSSPGTFRMMMVAWDATGKASLTQSLIRVNELEGGEGTNPIVPEPAAGLLLFPAFAAIARRRRRGAGCARVSAPAGDHDSASCRS